MKLIILSGLPGTGKSTLKEQYHADCRVIECICSDEAIHHSRLKGRKRNIPGWHELEWSEVERVKQ